MLIFTGVSVSSSIEGFTLFSVTLHQILCKFHETAVMDHGNFQATYDKKAAQASWYDTWKHAEGQALNVTAT